MYSTTITAPVISPGIPVVAESPGATSMRKVYPVTQEHRIFAERLGLGEQLNSSSIEDDQYVYMHCGFNRDTSTAQHISDVAKIHSQMQSLLIDKARKPDTVHLHLEHPHNLAGQFNNLYNDLEGIAEKWGLDVTMRWDSGECEGNSPHLEKTSLLEVNLAEPHTMKGFINEATTTFEQYMATNRIKKEFVSLLAHPNCKNNDDDPVDEYDYHYKDLVVLSNPEGLRMSLSHVESLLERMKTTKTEQ